MATVKKTKVSLASSTSETAATVNLDPVTNAPDMPAEKYEKRSPDLLNGLAKATLHGVATRCAYETAKERISSWLQACTDNGFTKEEAKDHARIVWYQGRMHKAGQHITFAKAKEQSAAGFERDEIQKRANNAARGFILAASKAAFDPKAAPDATKSAAGQKGAQKRAEERTKEVNKNLASADAVLNTKVSTATNEEDFRSQFAALCGAVSRFQKANAKFCAGRVGDCLVELAKLSATARGYMIAEQD